MAVVKNLMVRAGADFSGLKKETEKAQKTLSDFKSSTSNIMGGLKRILSALAIGKVIKDSIQSAMTVESSMQQIGRIMGENANDFMKWANSQATAFNMSKSEALKYGAVYGNLVRGFSKDTGEAMKNTEDLLKASAIVSSATGRSMEDTMDRIRSGLLGNTESIEDLGINVNVAMIQSTEAFKKFAGNKSWQQLDFQTQQQIRLMAILEQTYKKYGDTVSNNTASSLQQLIAQLKNLQLALGQAFLPIINLVLPILTKFVSYLVTITNVVAQFMQALFGKSVAKQAQTQTKATTQQSKAVTGLGNAYKGAGSKAKGALASFDEINALSKASGDVGGGGSELGGEIGGGVSITPNVDDSSLIAVSEKIKQFANSIKQYFKEAFGPTFEELRQSIANIIKSLQDLWVAIGPYLKPLGKLGITVAVEILETTFKNVIKAISDDLKLVGGIFDIVTGVFTGNTDKIKEGFQKVKDSIRGVLDWVLFIQDPIGNILTIVKDKIGDKIPAIFENVKQSVLRALRNMKDEVLNIFKNLSSLIKTPLNAIIDAINTVIKGLNKIKFNLPDWIPGVGGKGFGINIPQVPKLAQGGYVGANSPILAMIGDNRLEGEVVAPESKIYEQTLRAAQDALGNGGGTIDLTINLGGTSIFHEIINGINRVQRIAGETLLIT